jgi:anti-sigma regulatory factor (Ser/Thr protein kinase)
VDIFVPNSAHLGNVESFLSRLTLTRPNSLKVTFHPKWVSVHPMVLATIGAIGLEARSRGVQPKAEIPKIAAMRYFDRMGVFAHLGIESGVAQIEHEPAGRFIPLTQIRNNDELGRFLIDMIPLLHADPSQAEPIKYVVSELVRNVLEHSGSSVGAVVCAQYFKSSDKLALAVADAGIGVLGSMRIHHPVRTSTDALRLALRPGVSGATPQLGGNEFNAGAGLFFTKAIASASENHFGIYSGDAFFKLKKSRDPNIIFADPASDNATWRSDLPRWDGTAVGINVSLADQAMFSEVLRLIRDAYALDVRAKKKARYAKPRFS